MHTEGRRQFFEKTTKGALGVAVLAVSAGTLEVGCNSNALSEIETWVPVGLAAFDSVVSLINPAAGTVLAVAVSTANNLWTALMTAIANYQNTSDPTTTLFDKVIAAIDALNSGFGQVIASLPVSLPAAVLSAAKVALALLVATLKSIQAKLAPSVPATPPPAAVTAHAPLPAPAKDAKDLVAKMNAIWSQNGHTPRLKYHAR